MRISDWSLDVCSSDLVPASAPYGASEILTVTVDSINAAPPSSTRTDEAIQLVGFLDDGQTSPLLTRLWEAGRRTMGLPILSSAAAERPEFDPITYGTEAAVDRKSVAAGKGVSVRVDLGGRRILKKKIKEQKT